MAEAALPIGLIALDIDGTLVDEDMVIGDRTKDAVAEALRRGIEVALVTGRMTTSAVPFAEALGLRSPVVGMQGAVIRAARQPGSDRLGRLLLHRAMPAGLAGEIIRWCVERRLKPHLNYLETMVMAADDPSIDRYRIFVDDRMEVVDRIEDWLPRPVTKAVAVGEGEHSLEVLEEARACFNGRASVTLSHPRFLEFLAPGVSKGQAIRWLSRNRGVPLAQCMAIGDQYNDLEMIAAVGHGVAMPSAPAGVRAVARHVAPPVEEQGAAQMIERLALGDGLSSGRDEGPGRDGGSGRGEGPGRP
jgi:Cof subfamily protein (haloacid dehalogenase superfamily)